MLLDARSCASPGGLLLRHRRLRSAGGGRRGGAASASGSRDLRPYVAREALHVREDRAQLLHRVIEDEMGDAERLVSANIGGDLVRGALERRPVARGGLGTLPAHFHRN